MDEQRILKDIEHEKVEKIGAGGASPDLIAKQDERIKTPQYNPEDAWVKQHIKDFGTEPSFF